MLDDTDKPANAIAVETKVKSVAVDSLFKQMKLDQDPHMTHDKLYKKIKAMKEKYTQKRRDLTRTGSGLTDSDIADHATTVAKDADGDDRADGMTIRGAHQLHFALGHKNEH